MQTPKWKALVVEFRKNEELLKGSRFADAFNAMLRNPTVSGVQHIQRWVGMEGVDNKQNQDGILGAITTDAISKFIEKCQTTKSVPSLVDQIPK
jgi:lysozyme family protein